MAGEWIKMRVDLASDPAVIGIAAITGLEDDAVVGKLHRLWSWASQHLRSNRNGDGNAPGVTVAWLDHHVRCAGFGDAMQSVGWLTVTEGGIAIPKFEDHMSQGAKQRAVTAIRAKRFRNAERNAATVTAALRSALPEKRREDNTPIVPTGTGAELDKQEPNGRCHDILAVFAHYRTHHPRSFPVPSAKSKEWKLIRDRLQEGATVDDLKAAIDGCHRTPHNLGRNDRGQKYLALELIVRNGSQVTRFAEAPPLEEQDDEPLPKSTTPKYV